MAHLYCPDRFESKVRLFICKLVNCERQEKLTQEERKTKKKKQKEYKKKEEGPTPTTRKALENSDKELVVPTAEEVQQYLDEIGETRFTGERFVDFYNGCGWELGNGRHIKSWKAIAKGWRHYNDKNITRYAKRQTNSANASGTQTDRGGECVQPRMARSEQLEGILQQEHFVPQSVVQELEGVVATALANDRKSGGVRANLLWLDGADDSLSTLANDFGPHAVIVWLSKVFEAALVRLEVPDERFSARQVVQVAEGLLRVLDVYKGLTAQQVLRAMERMHPSEKIDIMELLYKELNQ